MTSTAALIPRHDPAALDRLRKLACAEGDHDLMVPHAFAALDEAEIPHQAIAPAAHAGQATTFEETEHRAMMHRSAMPSILDGARILFAREDSPCEQTQHR